MSKLSNFAAKFFGESGEVSRRSEPYLDVQASTFVSTSGTSGSELYSLLTGSDQGQAVVSERSALSTSAVYASVGLIGGAIASLPFHIYKRTAEGRDRYDSDLWWLFNESPSPSWTSASAWQFSLQSILLKGDSFWIIQRASRFSPKAIGFKPVHPDNVTVTTSNGRNIYVVTEDGVSATYDQDDILHFTGLGFDGTRSLTPLRYALMHAAGTTLEADKYAGNFFRGGAQPHHAIEVPADTKISPEQREQLKESWSRQKSGYASKGSTPVLTGGMKVVSLSMNAEDAQLLETRQFGVEEIARIFGVPPHMIGKTDASTSWGSGIEQMSIGFVRYTLRRHLDMIQQEINRKLWPRSNQFFGEFNTDALMDGDSKSQADYFTKALGGPGTQGWMTINEVRKLKNQKPIEGGDKMIFSGAVTTGAQSAKEQQ
jgi:HK97 family phage portal protein